MGTLSNVLHSVKFSSVPDDKHVGIQRVGVVSLAWLLSTSLQLDHFCVVTSDITSSCQKTSPSPGTM